VRTWPLVLRDPADAELASLASQADDLLVIGTGRRTARTLLVRCPVARHCLANAHRPVLAAAPNLPSKPVTACAAGHSATAASTRKLLCAK
jgi:hypothetical protein